ncbi:MAG: endolytic transglycosylase MltG [Deltaproteobacteria bacterium]|nr:endolytic transglycosylase MltG [Deltaproteobacteria bacterium]
MTKKEIKFLTDAQLLSEIERCEFCEEKPCKKACPADCSPADFIMAVKKFYNSDFERAAALIYSANPLGGICGAVCPDRHCMAACSRKTFDNPVNIPAVQATIIEKAKEMNLSLYQVLIIASMVEKEAKIDEERPVIASVIHNRLKKGIGLYIDATVIYGLIREKGEFNGNLTRKDLETPTRFNTYIIRGLPPTPICNPGIKSINAVLMPAKTDYLYYVSKNDGSHHFCDTLECHNKAVNKYQVEYFRKKK